MSKIQEAKVHLITDYVSVSKLFWFYLGYYSFFRIFVT